MVDTEAFAKKLLELGGVKILDLGQATKIRAIHSFWIHDGNYYFLPPDGMTAAELSIVFDEFRDKEAIHFAYNAQSVLDMNHRPILPLDGFAEKYFSDPPNGVIKVTAVSRSKFGELSSVIDALKMPFEPESFPDIEHLQMTGYTPPADQHQACLSLIHVSGDWKHMRELEEKLQVYMAEKNWIREILVNRHAVKGLQPEVMLISTEAMTEKGRTFLADLAGYFGSHRLSDEAMEKLLAAAPPAPVMRDDPALAQFMFAPKPKEAAPELTPAQIYRLALETIGDTLKSMRLFEGMGQSISGNILLVHLAKKGIFGLGGQFGKDHLKSLQSAYRAAKRTKKLDLSWNAHYHYEESTRLLSVKAGPESERPPTGWKTLTME